MKKVNAFKDIQKIVDMDELRVKGSERKRLKRIDDVKRIMEKINNDTK